MLFFLFVLALLFSLSADRISAQSASLGPEMNPLWLRLPGHFTDGTTIAFSFRGHLFTVPASEIGLRNPKGKFLESIEVEPDVLVANDPGPLSEGRDAQVEKAVETLMRKSREPEGS
jgi:hypothetical protein